MKQLYLLAAIVVCLSTSVKLEAQIISVNPDSAVQGQRLNIVVTAENIDFTQGTNTVSFRQGSSELIVRDKSAGGKGSITLHPTFTIDYPAGYYKLSVTNTDKGVTYTRDSAIILKTLPFIDFITPAYATKGETVTITIHGFNTHFDKAGATNGVYLDNGSKTIDPISITPIDAVTMKAQFVLTASHSAGLYSITVYNITDGVFSKPGVFEVKGSSATPAIVSVTPAVATQGQELDIEVTAQGIDFTQGSNVVSFKQGNMELPMYKTNKNNGTSMTIRQTFTKDNPTGFYTLSILNTAANITLLKENAIEVKPGLKTPSLDSISPTFGRQGENVVITIYGTNTHFNKTGITNSVYLLNGNKTINAATTTAIDSVTIQAEFALTYACFPWSYPINVNNYIDGTISKINAFKILEGPLTPKILALAPDSAVQGQTLDIEVTAENVDFTQGTNMVSFKQGSSEFQMFNTVVNSATSMTIHQAFNTDHPTGYYNLFIYNTKTEIQLIKNNAFYLKPDLTKASLDSVSPKTARQGEKVTMTFYATNTNFDKPDLTNSVYLKSLNKKISATNITAIDSVTLEAEFTLTYGQPISFYSANIYNDSDGTFSIPYVFELTEGINTPHILKVTPDTLVAGETLDIEVTGENIDFTQGTNIVTIRQGMMDIFMNSSTADSPTTLFVNIKVNEYFPSGTYSLSIYNTSFDILLLSNQTLTRERAFYLKSNYWQTDGFSQIPEDKILFYPNPANHYLYLKKKYDQVQLYDMNGRKVLEWKHEVILDISGLHKGMYFIKLRTGNDINVQKVIIE